MANPNHTRARSSVRIQGAKNQEDTDAEILHPHSGTFYGLGIVVVGTVEVVEAVVVSEGTSEQNKQNVRQQRQRDTGRRREAKKG